MSHPLFPLANPCWWTETGELFSEYERASYYRYFSSRFKWPVVLLLPCLLAFLSSIATGEWHFSRLFVAFLVALSMIVPFRLADDLADRKQDQSRHTSLLKKGSDPLETSLNTGENERSERVRPLFQQADTDRELCITNCLQNYIFALGLLSCLAMIAVLATRGVIAVTLLLATALGAAIWYKVREVLRASVISNYHMVLTKYAVFELVLIDPVSWHIPIDAWWSSLTAYVLLVLWEVVHDATNRNSVAARRLALAEFCIWLAWTLWIVMRR